MRILFALAFAFCTYSLHSDAMAAHPQLPAFERFYANDEAKEIDAGLYLLGELNCVKCHQADKQPGLTLRSAPVLTDVGSRIDRQHIEKFIADPQTVKPGTLMPNLFAGLSDAEKEQKVTALTHFLTNTGSFQPTPASGPFVNKGRNLFHQVGCVACHGSQKKEAKPLATSVPLGKLDEKYSINALTDFLRDPHKHRPSGRMPNLNLKNEEARDIANYLLKDVIAPANILYQAFEGSWQELPDFGTMTPKSSGKSAGFDLTVAGKRNNFGIRFIGYLHIEKAGRYNFRLGSDDGSWLLIDGEKIVDVDGIHPHSTKTGSVELTAGVHEVIVDYFQGGGEWTLAADYEGPGVKRRSLAADLTPTKKKIVVKADGDTFTLDEQLVAEGRQIFASVGCANCHDLKIDNQNIKSTFAAKKLAELKPEGGCQAAGSMKGVPHFSLNETQSKVINTALSQLNSAETPTGEQAVFRTMATFNCYACHARNDIGGVEREREADFVGTIPEMGDEGRIPPALTGAGDKLNDSWLQHILNNGANDRPYMLTRMPKFGANHVKTLLTAFPELDRKTLSPRAKFDQPDYRVKAEGRAMVGDKGLSCVKCHPFGNKKSSGIQALDLQTMTNRLREDWFSRYMINPQEYRRGTRMPSAWPNGRTILPKVLDGDTNKQLSAIWMYLEDRGKAAVPLGVGGQTIVLEAKNAPIIYRNFITDLSPRGIAVGYPEEAHLAFDAEEMVVRSIWHGSFIDAAKHWVGRGQGNQNPLGDHLVKLPTGQPFAVLDSLDVSWPAEKARDAGYAFLGYELNKAGRPTFLYAFNGVTVADYSAPVPNKGDTNFSRTLTVTTNGKAPENLYLRVATGNIEKRADGLYVLDKILELKVPSDAITRSSNGKQELLLPVIFTDNKAELKVEYVW